MACVNTDKFTTTDLSLFIESIEKITRMERLKRERKQIHRAKYLANTLRYLDQDYLSDSSSTLSSTDKPEEESVLEDFEQKQIGYNSTAIVQNEYCTVDHKGRYYSDADSMSCHTTIYSMPLDCLEPTKIVDTDVYETIDSKTKSDKKEKSSHQYEDPKKLKKSTKSKLKMGLLGLVCKKYKKHFSSKSNSWHKSGSWTRLTIV